MKKISFTVDGQTINGTLISPDSVSKKLPVVLFIHGWNTGEKNYIVRAEAVSKIGFNCLTFDLRGHGQSQGNVDKLSRFDHLQDVLAAYDFLSSQKLKNIHVVGNSYGGYLATLLSKKRNIASLVLKSPALFPDAGFTLPTVQIDFDKNRQVMSKNIIISENKALSALHDFKNPVLLIESEADTAVPHKIIQNYIKACNEKLLSRVSIPGADHHLSQKIWKQQFIDLLVDWFKEQR